ncbi:hypothetical protein H0H81_003985 [Sphagnurus paluster]|uniref:F-box domain-containing protein n=1 Tax=Sphagnurus paluster TaxID=117069 RepID=A0A9P7FV17_9AGAR|nr:hypothetical protein H0H81_003985 [Sphagnurus paluster]
MDYSDRMMNTTLVEAGLVSTTKCSIEDLPQEILCEIFGLVHKTAGSSLNLSHVCAYWRHITIQLPRLWTTVRITQHDHTVLEDILRRSQGRPLAIYIYLADQCPENSTLGLWRSLILLAAEMKRCYRLIISAGRGLYKMMRSTFPPNLTAPKLKYLQLQCQGFQKEECLFPSITFHPAVLKHVALDGVGLQSADLSGVKTMVLKQLRASWLPDCFGSGPDNALETLILSNTSLPGHKAILTPRLRHVTLDRQTPFEFLGAVWSAPKLESMTLSRMSVGHWQDLQFCLTLLPYRLTPLICLTLEDWDTERIFHNPREVEALIQATPGLGCLHLMGKKTRHERILEVHDSCGGWPSLQDVYVEGVRQDVRADTGDFWAYEKARIQNRVGEDDDGEIEQDEF